MRQFRTGVTGSLGWLAAGAVAGAATMLLVRGIGRPSALEADAPTLVEANPAATALFDAWTAGNRDDALAGLAAIEPPVVRRELALALLDTLGSDADGVARVSAALSAKERPLFEVDALVQRAERDTAGALQAAGAIEDSLFRIAAIERVSVAGLQSDPRAVLDYAASVDDMQGAPFYEYGLETRFRQSMLTRWINYDPAGALAYIESDSATEALQAVDFRALADTAPARLLALVELRPRSFWTDAEEIVLEVLGGHDLPRAVAQVDAKPVAKQDAALGTVARGFGRRDPTAALLWARALQPPSHEAIAGVLTGVSLRDFARAADALVEEFARRAPRQQAASNTALPPASLLFVEALFTGHAFGAATARDFARLADGFAALDDLQARLALQRVVNHWALRYPREAFGWALANADRATAPIMTAIGTQLGALHADEAIGARDAIPERFRAAWLVGVAGGLAGGDAARAREWVAAHSGAPGFDDALIAIARPSARDDPEATARLLAASPRVHELMANQVARAWAEKDPAAAARWALDDAGHAALTSVCEAWMRRDRVAARDWILSLPSGANRDAALEGAFRGALAAGSVDTAVLDAFESASKRGHTIASALHLVQEDDVPVVQGLIATHISDDAERRRAEEDLARLQSN